MINRFLYILLAVLISLNVLSQASFRDSIYPLKEVSISAKKLHEQTIGLKIEKIDSTELIKNSTLDLADILSSQTPLYLKSYGIGSLAQISIRGTSSQQNAIFWNGFNLNAPSAGLSDYALVPGFIFRNIEILYGGGCSVYGNGIIGGSVHLLNEAVFIKNTSADINLSLGSFETYNEGFRVKISDDKLCSYTAFVTSKAKNNFSYINSAKYKNPEEKLTHAEGESNSFMEQITAKLLDNQIIDAAFWYQYNNRNLPPTMTEDISKANELDESLRSTLQWKKIKENVSFIAKGAYFHSFLHYTDPTSLTDSRIFNNTAILDFEVNSLLGGHLKDKSKRKEYTLNAGLNYTLNEANVESYFGKKQQNQASIFVSVLHKINSLDWTAELNLRKEFIEGYKVPFTSSFGMQGKIWKNISGRFNLSQNFRSPTLNDLYWRPGGNPDLKPEISRNEELGIMFKTLNKEQTKSLEINLTAFNSLIDNWILWVQGSNGFSSPENIKKVWSRGLETEARSELLLNKIKLKLKISHSYIKSTNVKKISDTDEAYKKQLIYTPMHSGLASVCMEYLKFELTYVQTYTGKRFTTSDNLAFLEAYSLGNIKLSKNIKLKQNNLRLQFDVDNIWAKSYQALVFRPMPGRFYRLVINYKF